MSIDVLAAMVRFGSVRLDALTPELQNKLSAFVRGELDQEEGENDGESTESDS